MSKNSDLKIDRKSVKYTVPINLKDGNNMDAQEEEITLFQASIRNISESKYMLFFSTDSLMTDEEIIQKRFFKDYDHRLFENSLESLATWVHGTFFLYSGLLNPAKPLQSYLKIKVV